MRCLKRLTILLAAAVPLALPAAAQETMPRFYVYGEEDAAAELKTCQVSHDEAVALLKSQLRGAGMTVETDPSAEGDVMDTYVNINALPIEGSATSCAYSFDISFETYGDATNPFTGSSEFTKLAYCNRGSLMVWEKAGAQAAIHAKLRDYVRDCLTKYRTRNDR